MPLWKFLLSCIRFSCFSYAYSILGKNVARRAFGSPEMNPAQAGVHRMQRNFDKSSSLVSLLNTKIQDNFLSGKNPRHHQNLAEYYSISRSKTSLNYLPQNCLHQSLQKNSITRANPASAYPIQSIYLLETHNRDPPELT